MPRANDSGISAQPAAAPPSAPVACERCGSAFACGMNDTVPCWCTALPALPREQLTQAMRQADGQVYAGCLCPPCLSAVVAAAAHG